MKNLVFYKYAPNNVDKLEFDDFHLDSIHQPEREFFKIVLYCVGACKIAMPF